MTATLKYLILFAMLVLAACSRYIATPIEGASIYLPFEGTLHNLGSAQILGSAQDGVAKYRKGREGKGYFAEGKGGWLEFSSPRPIALSGSIEISFDAAKLDWPNPDTPRAAAETMAVVSGKMPDRIRHITFNIYSGGSAYINVAYRDLDDNNVRLFNNEFVLCENWRRIALKIDTEGGETSLIIDGEVVAVSRTLPKLMTHGVDTIKIGTWHKTNQAFRGAIDNFVIKELDTVR